MGQLFLPVLIGRTSAFAYLLGANGSGLSRSGLGKAVGRMLECVGLTMVFVFVNVAVGMIATLGARLLMSRFVSLYSAADATVLGLPFLQAVTLQWWHQLARAPGA